MSHLANNEYWMSQAIQLARKGFYSTAPNPRVGCVIVRGNTLVAEGWHEYAGGPHAEINAINNADIKPGCDIYVTLEPCSHHGKTPPCVDALLKLKPTKVIIAMQDPNPLVGGEGVARLKQAGIEVVTGVLEAQAREFNCGFISRFENKRPFIRLKMASSLDGRTALGNGESQWITGEAARRDVQYLRARSSAILTSAATVLADSPSLNVRLSSEELGQQREVRQPVRVVLDSQLRLSGKEKLFNTGGAVWIYTLITDKGKHRKLLAAGADITVFDGYEGCINLSQLFEHLASREVNEVHTECGQTLAGALMREKQVDELVLYLAPQFLGDQARGLFDLGELTKMDAAPRCKIKQLRNVGEDIRITLIPEWN